MKKIVSLFGDDNEIFVKLNKKAKAYALSKNLEYEWKPQKQFNQEKIIEILNNADVGIIDVDPYGEEIFSKISKNMNLLVRFGVGYDQVDLKAASKNGIAIATTVGANTLGVAEMAVMLILSSRRKLVESLNLTKTGNWEKLVVKETIGSTIGILGFGSIGKAVAKLLKGFDVNILVYDPFMTDEEAKKLNVRNVDLETIFKESDVITVHMPYNDETHHIINQNLLEMMKPTSVIVNTARGGLIDEEALYKVCKDGKILGAALDVFEEEPLPLSSKLLELENIITTPHLSSQTEESLWRIYKMAIEISEEFLAENYSQFILNPDFKE